jgi:catechol 2,3-dioxygenase-like lactoylglutathione lyase family enzyme
MCKYAVERQSTLFFALREIRNIAERTLMMLTKNTSPLLVRKSILSAAMLLVVSLGCNLAQAQAVPESERVPVDVRRATLLVRDIDKSLPLYRDALGLKVVYDQRIGGGTDKDGKVTPPTVRLVLLRANDVFIGALGLMQRLNDPNPPAPVNKRPMAGASIIVINAKDLEERFEKIRAVPGVTVATSPERIEYPAPGGGVIPVLFSAVYDPDGFFIEINKILGAAAGAPDSPKKSPAQPADTASPSKK